MLVDSVRRSGVTVGIVYNGALADWLADSPEGADVISLMPETLWHQSEASGGFEWIDGAVSLFELARTEKPVVLHGVGLSLASGLPLDIAHLDQVGTAIERFQPMWYSEHLSAVKVAHGPDERFMAGVGLPVPFDARTLEQLVPKVSETVARLDIPVLLENSVIYVQVPDATMTEAEFMNRLCEASGAGVLLDLHNLMANEVNLGWDGDRYLDELDLTRVVEIHVAGGETLGQWYTDAHSGACPERVYALLEAVLPRAPSLRLVTLEVHESRCERVGMSGIEVELSKIRSEVEGARSVVA